MNDTASTNAFMHRYKAGAEGQAPLLLLHGTGGNENDLLPLAEAVAPRRAVLSPRGKVLENGMPRFFRRLAEGVFDEEDVVRRAHELADFVSAARKDYALTKPIALGFSNGANIAAAMLLLRPEALAGAILIRAMTPLFKTESSADLADLPVLIISGSNDPIVPRENAAHLARWLKERGAKVQHEVLPAGHGLMQADLSLASDFLARIA